MLVHKSGIFDRLDKWNEILNVDDITTSSGQVLPSLPREECSRGWAISLGNRDKGPVLGSHLSAAGLALSNVLVVLQLDKVVFSRRTPICPSKSVKIPWRLLAVKVAQLPLPFTSWLYKRPNPGGTVFLPLKGSEVLPRVTNTFWRTRIGMLVALCHISISLSLF